ncbi:hypothetical protein HJFPF1_03204 [Paramyrothecium foliicola]|nr:hypothetical protein HJFPF1_03204 [Paramyrothecium foliicola]
MKPGIYYTTSDAALCAISSADGKEWRAAVTVCMSLKLELAAASRVPSLASTRPARKQWQLPQIAVLPKP